MTPSIASVLGVAALLLAAPAGAALAPHHQNLRDLETLLQFLRQHPQVAASVTRLDLREGVIVWGADCRVVFRRQPRPETTPPMPGPQPPLVFASSTCPLDRQ